MATVTLGSIKFNWKGAYNSSTAYAVDDVVSSGGNSYVCIQAHTNQAVGNATAYWNIMSSKGVDADLLNIASTAQGDIYYNNGSAIARLGAGTSGQYLETKGTSQNPVWSTVSSGSHSTVKIDYYTYSSGVSQSGATHYVDIAGGNYVSFTPQATTDIILFNHHNVVHQTAASTGCDVYLMMGTSSTIGSGDTKLNYSGNHAWYSASSDNDVYSPITKTLVLPCTSLTVGTTYYVEQAGATHNSTNIEFNYGATAHSGYINGMQLHNVNMVHYKVNT